MEQFLPHLFSFLLLLPLLFLLDLEHLPCVGDVVLSLTQKVAALPRLDGSLCKVEFHLVASLAEVAEVSVVGGENVNYEMKRSIKG